MADLQKLAQFVEQGDNVQAVAEADQLLNEGVPAKKIIDEGLVKALQALKSKCTIENFQLLEVLLSSRAMVEVIDQVVARDLQNKMDDLIPSKISTNKEGKTLTLVIGTIQGDVHDLGKHLVATISTLSGINVINLGKDVSPETFVTSAIKEKADIIGVSALMTVCLPTINDIRPLANKMGVHPLIVAGGAAVQQADKDYLDVDYMAFDAFEGLNFFLGPKKENFP